jgi:hypothetical protein
LELAGDIDVVVTALSAGQRSEWVAPMTRIGKHGFDRERYDPEGDVLYLSRGPERPAATTFATRRDTRFASTRMAR